MIRLRFILLFAVMLVAGKAAAFDFKSGGIYYNILDAGARTVEVTNMITDEWNSESDYYGNIVIHSSVNYNGADYRVTRIASYAFCNSQVKSITIEEDVESISSNAFVGCWQLEYIEFPASISDFGDNLIAGGQNIQDIISYNDSPQEIPEWALGINDYRLSQVTLWVPKGTISKYKNTRGWSHFTNYEELLGETLTNPTFSYDGHYLTMKVPEEPKSKIYYSLDGSEPSVLYSEPITITDIGTVTAIAKRFGCYTPEATRYEVTYAFDGVTARTAEGGLLGSAIAWYGADKVEMIDCVGTLNDDDFTTIRNLSSLKILNMAAADISGGTIPAQAFANTKLQWYVSPYSISGVGSNIFSGCSQLAAITWNSSTIELPEDVATDVDNPNLLIYAKAQAMIPYTLKNVIVNGVANNISLADSTTNCNFICPAPFTARRISFTHNYQQTTSRGTTQGWETIALPFTVAKITHEKNGELTPISVDGAEKPFWLYELGNYGLEAAQTIRANIPYLICMPNDDAYADEYMQGGRVTFSATNADVTSSPGTTVTYGDVKFVPTYQRLAKADNIYALNVGESYNGNPMGSVFVANYREVRPFEAYSVHSANRSRFFTVGSLGGGDTTGISNPDNELTPGNGIVKVYSLSGTLLKQGPRGEVINSLPKGLYIIDGKKIIK